MKIEVRLFATLREGRKKVQDIEVEEDSSVCDILKIIEVKKEDVAICIVNGRKKSLDIKLHDGDVLSLFPAVGGG